MLYLRLRPSRVVAGLLALLFTPALADAQLVTAPGAGVSPQVRVIDTNGTERTFFAYHPAFTGGVRIALGDVTGDGILDIVTAPGPGGGPHVRVWNGVDLTEVGGFFAYNPAFPGGVWVAAGDVDGDGRADIITGAGAGGGPHVRIWSGVDFHEIGGFFAYHPAFPGGVSVAAGDVDGDGRADVITGAGPGGGPHVRVWSGADLHEIGGFFAYHPAFPGGVNVAAGDVNADGRADIITGAGPGGGPHVRVWNATNFAEIGGFFAYDPAFAGGINVAALDLTGDGRAEVITGVGPGGFPISSIWNGADLSLLGSYLAFDPSLRVGVFVASVGRSSALRFTSAASTSFTRGAAGSFIVTTAGGASVPALTVTGALPAGVTFVDNGNRTATLSGTPTASGVFPLTITADNGSSPPVTQSFTLTVTEAPVITSASSTTFNAGSAGSSFTVTTTGSPSPALSVTGALPTGITFTDNGNGTANLGGTAAPGTGGTYPLVITASNSVGTATQSFTLTINQGAAITSANAATFTAGGAGSFTITTTGLPTATTIGVTGTLPAGVTFVNNGNGTATVAGTPGATTGGTYALTFSASNGVGSPASQSFTLTVNQAPAITSAPSTTFLVGSAGSFTVTTTGFPAPGLVAGGTALPGGVTFVDNNNGTGTLAGTPAAGTAGSYALTFTATNVVNPSPVQNFTLTVACPAITVTPPSGVLTDGAYQQVYSQTFGASGSSGITFSVTAGALPPGLTLASNGALSGSPTNTGAFAFTVTATDAFACTGSAAYSLTVRPNAVDESYSGAVGNTQLVVAPAPLSSTPAVLVVGTVLSNDAGPAGLTAGPASIGTTNGGTVALGSNGAFVYTPAIGFAGPADTFVYTLLDGNGISDTATVTVNLSGVVWYVNNSGANGDGRSHLPFNNLSNAQAPSSAGDVIFVHAGTGTTPGSLVLKANQTLWGNAHGFLLNSLSINPAGTPLLGGTVTLANNVLVRAVNINAGAADAIVANGVTGTETIESVNITGGGTGYNLTNVGGTFTISNGSISGVSGTDLRISGGDAVISVGSPITNTAGRSVDIQNRTGGSVGFSAAISDTAQGILLNNNPGTPVLFLGGLTLNTGANAALTATNGGRVTATQDNVSIVNTITTTTGTALNLTNYDIGTFGLTFRSISSNGAVNGIVLNNTGSGTFTVTGAAGAGSGGTINASTGPGVLLTSTGPMSLSGLTIQNGGDDGIRGISVNGFTLTNVTVTNNGNAVGEHGIDMTELTGTGAMTGVTVSGSAERNVRIANTAGTLSSFTVTGSTFANTNMTTGDDGFLIEQNGTGAMTVSITGSTFTDNKGDHFQVASDADAAGSITVTFSNNTLTTTSVHEANVIGGGITISPSGSTAVTFTMDGNDIQQAFDDGINLNLGTASTAAGSLVGTISNNVIGTPGAVDSGSQSSNGITVTSNGAGTTTVAVTNNQVYQYANAYGILVNNKEGSSTLNATVTGNTVANPGTFALNGIRVDAGATSGPPADSGITCAALSGNSVSTSGLLTDDIRLRQRFSTTIRLPGYAGSSDDTAAVNAFVQGNNGGAGTAVSSSHNVGGGGFGFLGGAPCLIPQ